MPLVYLPDREMLFLWGADSASPLLTHLTKNRGTCSAALVTPKGHEHVEGLKLPLLETLSSLTALPASLVGTLPGSLATWTLASKFAIELISRERIVPTIAMTHGRVEARWAAALSLSEDAARFALLARSMPPASHAVAMSERGREVWAPDALLRAYLDATVDAVVRASRGAPTLKASKRGEASHPSWPERFYRALEGSERTLELRGFTERSVLEDVARWSEPALGAHDRLRACFRLEIPSKDHDPFTLRFLLQSPEDPSLVLTASEVWSAKGSHLEKLGRAFKNPQESLLEALGRASRLFAPIGASLRVARPEMVVLDPASAWAFLDEGARLLGEAGFGVILPAELTPKGQRRLKLRMRVGNTSTKVAGAVSGAAGLAMEELLTVDWDAVIGDEPLTKSELAMLAKQKASLVQFRGAWIAIDPSELLEIQKRIGAPEHIRVREAVLAALAGEMRAGPLSATVVALGSFSELLGRLRDGSASPLPAPKTLLATLRPYQERGLHWLSTMGSLGLGACLADDMGLGKTMQLLAFLLRRKEEVPSDTRPSLLVAPTSVIGNWEREIARFAPSTPVIAHYGSARVALSEQLRNKPGALVITTYGLLRRDVELLSQIDFAVVALDEAQNIKNSAAATAQAARTLRATHRFALTGTPVENRLAELWSIFEFANPGLLGPLQAFRREFAVPIERYGNEEAAARLRRIVGPFILRRLKSDRTIIQDLPAKHEMKVICTLTREQASLYKAVVDEEMRRIETSDGIERRGRVLALLTFTKQVCNHPAQYLGEAGPLPKRSGKLARATEMLEEAISAGDKALVFTQFREMGDKLTLHLQSSLECEVLFLHGGTSKKARDEMVRRFQEEPHGPRVFILSVKAGGTGLNLTAASHVFHYDRWWNPAVEDQATDRAYRIGQKRAVQVHKLVSAGTVEEKIDRLLEQKRELASKVVGTGEQWITELGTEQLRDLFALSESATAVADESDDENGARTPKKRVAKKIAKKPAKKAPKKRASAREMRA